MTRYHPLNRVEETIRKVKHSAPHNTSREERAVWGGRDQLNCCSANESADISEMVAFSEPEEGRRGPRNSSG